MTAAKGTVVSSKSTDPFSLVRDVSKLSTVETLINLSKIDQENDYYIYGGSKKEIQKLKNQNQNKNLYLNEYISYKNLPKIMLKMNILTLPYTKIIN